MLFWWHQHKRTTHRYKSDYYNIDFSLVPKYMFEVKKNISKPSTSVWLFLSSSFRPTHLFWPRPSMYVRAKGTASAFCCKESGPLLKHLTSTVLLHKHVCFQDPQAKCRIQISSRKTSHNVRQGFQPDSDFKQASSYLQENISLQDMKISKLHPNGVRDMFCEISPPW